MSQTWKAVHYVWKTSIPMNGRSCGATVVFFAMYLIELIYCWMSGPWYWSVDIWKLPERASLQQHCALDVFYGLMPEVCRRCGINTFAVNCFSFFDCFSWTHLSMLYCRDEFVCCCMFVFLPSIVSSCIHRLLGLLRELARVLVGFSFVCCVSGICRFRSIPMP